MTLARKSQIDLSQTPYYHCTSRCVRGAFLCGENTATGQAYNHRKQWLVERIAFAESIFAIDVCAYAVMSNHFHVVLRVNEDGCKKLSDLEVAQNWLRLYHGNRFVRLWLQYGDALLSNAERAIVTKYLNIYRQRLNSISWFMRIINEHISRKSNQEDGCKGHFWQGRFKSQALLDESALLTCMAYVDLNPIRANLAQTPEESSYTSIQTRIQSYTKESSENQDPLKPRLLPFMKANFQSEEYSPPFIPYIEIDYFEFIDWAGRVLRADKAGAIPEKVKPILERLNISTQQLFQTLPRLETKFSHAIGLADKMRCWCKNIGLRWCKGLSHSQLLFR